MKHDFIDKYCHLDSPLHRLDPRGKLLFCLSLLIIIISTNNLKLFAIYYPLLAILMILSRVPAVYYLKRMLLVTPFATMIALFMLASAALSTESQNLSLKTLTHPVYLKVSLIILKTYASIILLTILTSVTRFNYLLWAMRKFKFPTIITTLSRLVYTYIFLLIDELHATQRALKSRAPIIRMPKTKIYGNIAASILLKSIHRSQIVYYAMISRKFSGEFPEGEANCFKFFDLAAAACFVMIITSVFLLWKM
jgi:cobalt/nickel transport system permease protein